MILMISIKNLSKKFDKTIAVDDLNLEIKEGICFGLLGRNGAGKTTTIKMLTGLLKPDSGQISYDGLDIYSHPLEVKKMISYIPDMPYVYEKLTGIEFLHFVGKMYEIDKNILNKRIENLCKLFQIEEFINRKTENYSHGTRQKLVFISSLLHKPKYLIIDEPLVGLDPQSAKLIRELIVKLTKTEGITTILTTHQLYVAEKICDKIGIIHNGKLLKMFEKNEFENKLEHEFINVTGSYDSKYLDNIF